MVDQAHGKPHPHHIHCKRRHRSRLSRLRHSVQPRLREVAIILAVLTFAVIAVVYVVGASNLPL